jgi:hypothetical protein
MVAEEEAVATLREITELGLVERLYMKEITIREKIYNRIFIINNKEW